MILQFNKRITVHKIVLKPGSLFSEGIGFDDDQRPIEFIGHTNEMKNIKTAIEDYDDGESDGLPSIYLKPWQWEDTQ